MYIRSSWEQEEDVPFDGFTGQRACITTQGLQRGFLTRCLTANPRISAVLNRQTKSDSID